MPSGTRKRAGVGPDDDGPRGAVLLDILDRLGRVEEHLVQMDRKMQQVEGYSQSRLPLVGSGRQGDQTQADDQQQGQQTTPPRSQARLASSDLNRLLLPIFRHHPKPDASRMAIIKRHLARLFPALSEKETSQAVNFWFRKRRERNGLQVFAACNDILAPLLVDPTSISAVIREVDQKGTLYSEIAEAVQLEIVSTEVRHDFLRDKIHYYIGRYQVLNQRPE